MAPYALALILLLGIPFLLYCLWNFAREVKPRRKRALMFSALPSCSQPGRVPRLVEKSTSLRSLTNLRGSDHDFTTPARVS